MEQHWNSIKGWLGQHAPHLLDSLNSGAEDSDFEDLEARTGIRLPEEFKAFYRIHNGQKPYAEGLWAGEELLSTTRIVEEWVIWKNLFDQGEFHDAVPRPDEGIRADWFHPYWLPITYDGSGNHDCLDLAPAETGKRGQVLRLWHDDGERPLMGDTFTEWVELYADELDRGVYEYNEDYGIIESEEYWENEADD